MRKKTISVLGCGWLGLPLAQELAQEEFLVKGSTTTSQKLELLQNNGIEPFLLSFPENAPESALAQFLDSDYLVFNLPPSRSSSSSSTYEALLQRVLKALPPRVQGVLFVSSTSVYPDLNREVTEEDALPNPEATSLLLRCEHLVQQATNGNCTIVRFGGLMGGNRHPGRFLAGKTEVPQPQAPVNMIHLADCVELLKEILHQEKWGFTFNACAPEHPTKKNFYERAARSLQLTPPSFAAEGEAKFKSINSDLITQELNYSFQFPDPLLCLSSPHF
ncbi:SDR family oxidoreductase [Rufibacter glacialis]|uniref:SDR family oxidoreductase n=1 Tax=Rufibacter glacialis TaxID=1259555 RepID=A0A5M8QAG5_9BACT|nr:SDR family oxidoreductase [Rufibacter glacialis]KAA6431816.1 SDR family oxidoreductase [Rufibacter glacialis]